MEAMISPTPVFKHGSPSHHLRDRVFFTRKCASVTAVAIICLHVFILGWEAFGDSVTWDEVGHFAAGLEHWHHGNFTFYRVNPPLVRLLALAPIAIMAPQLDPYHHYFETGPGIRPEVTVGPLLARQAGYRYFYLISVARWSCIPISIIGAWICFLWSRELWGHEGGLITLLLWSASPTVLGYGHLITPDLAAATFAVLGLYTFRSWLHRSDYKSALLAGLILGLALLTKYTLVLLPLIYAVVWLEHQRKSFTSLSALRRQLRQILVGALVAIWVINAGYAFEKSFTPLGKLDFVSSALRGNTGLPNEAGEMVGNRFRGTPAANLPLPVPPSYLLGIDQQRLDFEHGYWSYLRGQWRFGGWWYFYVYAFLLKEPLGFFALLFLAAVAAVFARSRYTRSWCDECFLFVPAAAVFVFVSSQTGFSHHLRYVLPAFPFLFISVGRLGRSLNICGRRFAVLTFAAVTWSVASSVLSVPHSLSYFNELAGGPTRGHWYLGKSNADYGQDLLYLRTWALNHPTSRPLYVKYYLPMIDPQLAGIECLSLGRQVHGGEGSSQPSRISLHEGWYAISVNYLHSRNHEYDFCLDLPPVARAGYSIQIYHLTADQLGRSSFNRESYDVTAREP